MAIEVLCAMYGVKEGGNDVTGRCKELLEHGNDDLIVNSEVLGVQPGNISERRFSILYKLNGTAHVRFADEGDQLDLA
ncbi:MAG: hypothetical protein OIF57_01415 [Marinobacterium sp.]|nr:hypothetical protein [Marinobacterium sp.]